MAEPDAGGVPQAAPGTTALAEFLHSRLACAALLTLLLIAAAALLAPWIAPQDPYDLAVIDVREGRLPPGATKLSEPVTVKLQATTAALRTATDLTLETSAQREVDRALAATLVLRLRAVDASRTRRALAIVLEPGSTLAPVTRLEVDGLPAGASLSHGEKARFRNRWTVAGDALPALELRFAGALPQRLDLRLSLTGGERRALMTYWLGTDDQGRDMLSAILYGLRISLAVALGSVVIAVSLGTLLGLYAAYLGGRFDTVLMRVVDLQLSFPTILVALILLAVLGKGLGNVLLALIIVQWAFYARTARGVALAERRREYVEAAHSLALGRLRIMVRHILPNCLPSLIVIATLQIASAITLEATLSFLGLGLPVTQPSLGLLIANGFQYLLAGYPWISILPGLALLVTVVSINLVGDELRDLLNPRLR